MPKLLQINVCSAMLSTGKISEDISKVAMKHGWETYTIWGRSAKPSISVQIHIGSTFYTHVHYLAHKLFDCEGLVSRVPTKKMIKIIKDINPDIIQLHNLHDHYLNYPILFKFLASFHKPVVWTQHDCWAFTGGCMYYDLQKCDRWKTGCKNCSEHRAVFYDTTVMQYELKRNLLLKIQSLTFVPVSDWLGDALRESHQKDRNIYTIHNGIDINLFHPVKRKECLRDRNFHILGVAAVWDERKGLEDFIKLRSILSANYTITLVGLSQKQIDLLPEGIKGFTRTTNVQELVQLYSDSDVFVNPTYSDNFPTTNIEALACGTPVITYKTGGSPEAIRDGKECKDGIESIESIERYPCGMVINQGDVTTLANAIKWMKANPLSGDDCRKRAEQYFDKDKCFEKYINLYEYLLNEHE